MTSAVRGRRGLLLTFAFFVILGLPEGVLGTAWPSMRASLGQPASSLAWLTALYTTGYFLSTAGSGHVCERYGVSVVLRSGVAMTAVGLALYAVTQTWWLALVAACATGIGGGTVDAAGNTYCAVVGGVRSMNLLHAMFGLGAAAGPVTVTASLELGGGWRSAYVAVLAAELVLLGFATRHRAAFGVPIEQDQALGSRQAMPRRLLVLMMAIFFFYVSGEAAYGQWAFSVLTDDRGVGTALAAWSVAAYWGGLTVGRLLLGYLGSRVHPMRLLHLSLAGIVGGSLLFWQDPAPGIDLAALPWLGFSMAGVFPALVLVTPRWLGVGNTGRAVGYQLAASSVGVIATSGLLGWAVSAQGLSAMPVVGVLLTVGTLVSFHLARVEADRTPPTRSPVVRG